MDVLITHRSKLEALAEKLVAEETVDSPEFEALFSDLPPKENIHGQTPGIIAPGETDPGTRARTRPRTRSDRPQPDHPRRASQRLARSDSRPSSTSAPGYDRYQAQSETNHRRIHDRHGDAVEAYLDANQRSPAGELHRRSCGSRACPPSRPTRADCQRAADWLADQLRAIGLDHVEASADRRPSDRLRRLARRGRRADGRRLRPLRRPAGRSARRMDVAAVRAGRGRGRASSPAARATTRATSRSSPQAVEALLATRGRPAGEPALRVRGRGGVVVRPPRAVARREPRAARRRRRDRQRRRLLRGQPAGVDDRAARPDVRPDRRRPGRSRTSTPASTAERSPTRPTPWPRSSPRSRAPTDGSASRASTTRSCR